MGEKETYSPEDLERNLNALTPEIEAGLDNYAELAAKKLREGGGASSSLSEGVPLWMRTEEGQGKANEKIEKKREIIYLYEKLPTPVEVSEKGISPEEEKKIVYAMREIKERYDAIAGKIMSIGFNAKEDFEQRRAAFTKEYGDLPFMDKETYVEGSYDFTNDYETLYERIKAEDIYIQETYVHNRKNRGEIKFV